MSPVEQLEPVLEFGGVVLVIRNDVTGRHVDGRSQKVPEPVIDQLYVRELSPESDGNATGIGLA